MLYRGLETSGKFKEFTLRDCPVEVGRGAIALVSATGTELLRKGTIARGTVLSSGQKIFEGDKIYIDSRYQGFVIYCKAFCIQGVKGAVKSIKVTEHIKVDEADKESTEIAVSRSERTPISWVHEGNVISISDICYNKGDKLIIENTTRAIPIREMLEITGLRRASGEMLCYEELYKGGIVKLIDGKPVLKLSDDEFVDIDEEDLR